MEVWVRSSCSATSEVDVPRETVSIDSFWRNDVGGSSLETRMWCVSEDGGRRGMIMLRVEFGGLYGELGGRGLRRTEERGASASAVIKIPNTGQRVEIQGGLDLVAF